MKIKIENFRVVNKPDIPRFKAVTDVILEESLVIRDIKLIELLKDSVSQLFIAMPSRKTPSGEYKDICHPTVVSCRTELERPIVEYFKYGRYSEGFKEEFKVTEVKVRKIDSNNELKAVASVVFNDKLVVHDIKLVERVSSDESYRRFEIYMPSKKINESFVEIVSIINENLKSEIFNKIIEQYKGM